MVLAVHPVVEFVEVAEDVQAFGLLWDPSSPLSFQKSVIKHVSNYHYLPTCPAPGSRNVLGVEIMTCKKPKNSFWHAKFH